MAPHDDLYFAKMADYLIHGQWMGPYNQLTLIKGPFFEFFLVLSGLTGLPLLLNETVFYLMACLVLYSAVSPLAKSAWWRLLLFALVLFSPASLITYWTLRVYREFVYASLTLFVIAFSVGLFLRIAVRPWIQFLWAAGLGASMGAFMLCREEGPWIYPVLGLLLAACLWGIWRGAMDRKWLRSAIALSPILIWCIAIFAVSFLNYSHYGFWGYSENMDPDLNRVLNTIGRIRISVPFPYNAITRESLAKAYKAAPLLANLQTPIESGWDGAAGGEWHAPNNAGLVSPRLHAEERRIDE